MARTLFPSFGASAPVKDPAQEMQAMFALKQKALDRSNNLDEYLAAFSELAQGNPLINENNVAQIAADLSHTDANGHGHVIKDFLINKSANESFNNKLNFKNTVLNHVRVDPYNSDVAEAAKMEEVTFNGMTHDDHFVLKGGQYKNITISNCDNGKITFDGAQVDGLTMNDNVKVALFSLKNNASINGLEAQGIEGKKGAHIVQIDGSPGACIYQANFAGATIAGASHMQGMQLTGVNFANANIRDVDFSGASFTGGTLPNDLKGVNFSGASFTKMKLEDGTDITSPQQLAALGATVDQGTAFKNAPAIAMEQAKAPAVPAMFAGLNLGSLGAQLASLGIGEIEHADHTTITPGSAPVVVAATDKAAPIPAKAAPSMDYFAKMSAQHSPKSSNA